MISVFLSLAGSDKAYVDSVYRRLPEGLAHYYPVTFANGEHLIEAMQRRVGQATIFVLFASRASAKSHWVNFEIERARIQSITSPQFRLLVFPTDNDVSVNDLPTWVREYWIPNAGYTTLDVSRYIRHSIVTQSIAFLPAGKGLGRGAFTDLAIQLLTQNIVDRGSPPNVFIFAGVNGIGRRTAARRFLEAAFPATPELLFGPELQMPQFADLDDFYRGLRKEIDPSFSIERFGPDLEVFRRLSIVEQVNELSRNLRHFFSLG